MDAVRALCLFFFLTENTFNYETSIFKRIVHIEWITLQWPCNGLLQTEAHLPPGNQSPLFLFHPSFPALLRSHSTETAVTTAFGFANDTSVSNGGGLHKKTASPLKKMAIILQVRHTGQLGVTNPTTSLQSTFINIPENTCAAYHDTENY